MSRARRPIAMLVIALAVSLHASTALAAPAGWKSVDVTQHSDQQQPILLVSGELPAEVKLPAEAELAVPAGTQLQWIGEVLGGDMSKDPALKYTMSSANGMDIYRFTLAKARIAQVEGVAPSATSFDGTDHLAVLKWTAWTAVPEVRISQRFPQGSQIVQAVPGAAVQPGGNGYSYYTKTVKGPKAGDVLDLSFSYRSPAAGPTSTSGSSGSTTNTLALAVIMVIAVVGFGLLAINVNKKMAAKAALNEPRPRKSSKQDAQPVPVETPRTGKKEPIRELAVEAPPRRINPFIPTLVIIGILLAGFAVAGNKGTSPAVLDGKITRDFGAPSACQSASMSFTANQGVDLAKQGEQLLIGLEGMEGVGEVTIDIAQSKIDMAWCESSQSEESMRQALSKTGLITLGQGASSAASASATATVDATGQRQAVTVDTSSGSFAPSQLLLKAGIPTEISFGPAVGCLSEVVIEELGINQDLTKGPATVKLPALEAGTYPFACAMGHQSGQLVVR